MKCPQPWGYIQFLIMRQNRLYIRKYVRISAARYKLGWQH